MVEEWVVSTVLEAGTAVAAAFGAVKVIRLNRFARDARLARLALFFGLMAASAAIHVLSVLDWERRGSVLADDAPGLQDVLFWAHHAAFLGALAAAALALGPYRPSRLAVPVLVPVLLVAEPLLRLVETAGVAYLLVRTLINHMRRTSLGSLTVGAGFLALLVGQAVFLYNDATGPDPLGARAPLGEALVFLGLLVLAVTPPRRRASSA